MTTWAVILLSISAVTHAAWNLVSKRQQPNMAFFIVANTAATLLLLPAAGPSYALLGTFGTDIWFLLVATGFFQALYYAAIGRAYRRGDMSVAYPIARSMPVIITVAVAFALGRRSQISTQSIVGMALVVVGGLLLPAQHFRDFKLRNYVTPLCALALVAAACTAGYSTIDDEALRRLRGADRTSLQAINVTLLFAFVEGIAASLWLAVFLLFRPRPLHAVAGVLRAQWRSAVLAGAGICITYTLALLAMGMVRNVSYVVAFRQMSIVAGVLLGIMVLKEKAHVPKLAGVAFAAIGLVLVGTG